MSLSSPLLSSSSYSSVDSNREPVPDAAAIYFVTPSQETVSRLCRDLHSYLYESYHFNFITPVPRPLLEEVAKAAVDANCVSQISKVERGREGGRETTTLL